MFRVFELGFRVIDLGFNRLLAKLTNTPTSRDAELISKVKDCLRVFIAILFVCYS